MEASLKCFPWSQWAFRGSVFFTQVTHIFKIMSHIYGGVFCENREGIWPAIYFPKKDSWKFSDRVLNALSRLY